MATVQAECLVCHGEIYTGDLEEFFEWDKRHGAGKCGPNRPLVPVLDGVPVSEIVEGLVESEDPDLYEDEVGS